MRRILSAVVLTALCCVLAAGATITVTQGNVNNAPAANLTTARANWEVSIAPTVGSSALETFESYAAGTHYSALNTAVGEFTAGGQGSTGSGTGSVQVSVLSNPNVFSGRFNYTTGGAKWLDSNDITLVTLNFANVLFPVNYLSFFMTDVNDVNGSLKLKLMDGTTTEVPIMPGSGANASGASYLFTYSGDALTSIQWVNNSRNDGFGIDDVYIASRESSVDTVPEPGTWAMIGGGLLGLGLWRKRRA